jgi:hypothetical protein
MKTALIVIAAVLLMLFILSRIRRKPKTLLDDVMSLPEMEMMMEFQNIMDEQCKNCTKLDEIPGGYGEFGLSVTNPVPTHTILGSNLYLSRLRTLDNKEISCNRIGSTGSDNIENPIDMYRVDTEDGKHITIYLSPYHLKNSNKTPKGFKFVQADVSISEENKNSDRHLN